MITGKIDVLSLVQLVAMSCQQPVPSRSESDYILWEYTGYPSFWQGEPIPSCVEQLRRSTWRRIMPYIPPDERRVLLLPHAESSAEHEGELNYQITCLLNDYMVTHGMRYGRMGDCVAALENAKHEFQRRVMDDYEDHKMIQNGDVYSKVVAR